MTFKMMTSFLIAVGLILLIAMGIPQQTWHWFTGTHLGSKFASYSSSESDQLPAPLRGLIDPSVNSHLTMQGVIDETNKRREQNGESVLRSNAKLQAAAESKIDDMFNQQYFEHKSPDGKSPADIISAQGYEYLVVGENLALGNFKDDNALVEAWMNSPGHRANILNAKYQEIGVAVRKGTFEGNEVWLAVQEFGTPLSSCPATSSSLKSEIDANRSSIATMQSDLQRQKSEIEANRYSTRDEYNQAVDSYNALAARLNKLSEETQKLVNEYNSGANAFNKCLESNS